MGDEERTAARARGAVGGEGGRAEELQPATLAVHAGRPGWRGDGETGLPRTAGIPTSPPIHLSTAYWHPTAEDLDRAMAGEPGRYSYARFGSPTVAALEEALAALEGTEAACAYPSGMAAVFAALSAAGLGPGTSLLLSRDVYGATLALARDHFAPLGVEVRTVDATDLRAVAKALAETRPTAFLFESVSNPLLRVADGPELVRLAKAAGARVVVDNTFATPLGARPAEWGADFVVHSTTKFLAGHGDVLGGAVLSSAADRELLSARTKLIGSVPSPFDAWLALRGLRTLHVRLARQEENAARLADWLAGHPAVARVHYPGRPDHPDHEVARRVLRGPGAMVSADLAGGRPAASRLLASVRLWVPATTLGDCHSLVLYPAESSHRGLTPAERHALGIGDGLVRFSVGIEAFEDLRRDLARALAG